MHVTEASIVPWESLRGHCSHHRNYCSKQDNLRTKLNLCCHASHEQ